MILISGYQARELLRGMKKGVKELEASLDLGLTKSKVSFEEDAVLLSDRQAIGLTTLEKMSKELSDCFYLEKNQAYRIQCYSEHSRKFLKLYATGLKTAPTVSVSGIRMHQTKSMNPIEDTLAKVEPIKRLGVALDTCTGLGYTAIYARRGGARRVVTVEIDPIMIEIAMLNPWSSQLFEDEYIERKQGDVSVLVGELEDNSFDSVIHDPPRLSLAGALYSSDFYRELYRVMKPNGRLFHYVGDPGGRYRSRRVDTGVKKRLLEAGFCKVEKCVKAQGLRAFKKE
ncbi:MAG: methyltransferase domain-containing protein [Candidatus Altiarchaeota archaeon]